jgi:hypothetical protein
MRTLAVLGTVVLAIAACHEAPTSPGPAPSGLPATLRRTSSTGTPFAGPPIVAQGDSLVASAELHYTGCLDYTAVAGTVGGAVVVTILEAPPRIPRACLAILESAVFHVVVRPAPHGTYLVVLRERFEGAGDGPMEREWVRGSVTVP